MHDVKQRELLNYRIEKAKETFDATEFYETVHIFL